MDTKTKYLLILFALLAAGGGYWWFTKKSASTDQEQTDAVDQSLANYEVPPSIGAQSVVGDPNTAQAYGGIPIGGTVQQKQAMPLPYNT